MQRLPAHSMLTYGLFRRSYAFHQQSKNLFQLIVVTTRCTSTIRDISLKKNGISSSFLDSSKWTFRRKLQHLDYSGSSAIDNSDNEVPEGILYPTYVPRSGETVDVKRARLLYQSRKRGMLENGLLLSTFASTHLSSLTPYQLDLYDNIINQPSNDWQLYYWMVGKEDTPANYDNEVMDMLKVHARNERKESRYRQPDLPQ